MSFFRVGRACSARLEIVAWCRIVRGVGGRGCANGSE